MNEPISVVVPTVGDSPALRAALTSALAALGEGDDVLAVYDEAAGRGTRPAVEELDPRVRVLTSRGRGVSAARNTGLAEATGSGVAFLDDDDLWLPEHLAVLRRARAAHPDAGLLGTHPLLFDDPHPERGGPAPPSSAMRPMLTRPPAGVLGLAELVAQNPFTPSAVLVDRALAVELSFDETLTHLEDWELWLRLSQRARTVFIDEVTVHKREQPGGASRRRRAMAEGGLAALAKLCAEGRPAALPRAVLRRREAELLHDLAYALLIAGEHAPARRAALDALERRPTRVKSALYVLVSLLPRAAARALFRV